jgi:hypothetical protein
MLKCCALLQSFPVIYYNHYNNCTGLSIRSCYTDTVHRMEYSETKSYKNKQIILLLLNDLIIIIFYSRGTRGKNNFVCFGVVP